MNSGPVLSSRTKKMIRALPDAGLKRVVNRPNEGFGCGWPGPCLYSVAFEGDEQRASAFVRATRFYLPMETEEEQDWGGFDLGEGFDLPLLRAKELCQSEAYLNEIKSFSAEVLASRCGPAVARHTGAIPT